MFSYCLAACRVPNGERRKIHTFSFSELGLVLYSHLQPRNHGIRRHPNFYPDCERQVGEIFRYPFRLLLFLPGRAVRCASSEKLPESCTLRNIVFARYPKQLSHCLKAWRFEQKRYRSSGATRLLSTSCYVPSEGHFGRWALQVSRGPTYLP